MSFCYLYSEKPSPNSELLLDSFENSKAFDIDSLQTLDDYDVYLIEIESVDKEISLKLNTLFKDKVDPLIYFYIPKKYTLMLIQLMFLLGTKSIFTQRQEILKIVSKIKADREEHRNSLFEKKLGEINIATHSLMGYKNKKLLHVSEKLLKEFSCDTLESFEDRVCSGIDIERLLDEDIKLNHTLSNMNTQKEYIIESVTLSPNEKVIYFEEEKDSLKDSCSIISRVTFMELLKEKLSQTNSGLSAITISMQDMPKLQKALSIVEIEEYFSDGIHFMDSLLEEKLVFAQLEIDFYIILFEGVEFNEIHDRANSFHNQILNDIANKDLKSIIDVFTVNLENFNFEESLDIFNNIRSKELTYEQKHSDCIEHTSHTQTVISEDTLLEDAFRNKTEFKLINIYNGLVISTPSKIVKKSSEGVYIKFEQLQGVVMNIDKETVLQSNSFLHDIQAEIKVIDLKKKLALLEGFKFLSTNVNSRKYARVTTSSKIPISMTLDSSTINGHIIDLSIKSIAVNAKYSNKVEELDQENVILIFNIPSYKFDEGYTQLTLGANVAVIIRNEKDGTCKIVCDLDKDSNNESVIMDYVYDRQKELIIEVKKMSKLL